MADDSSSTSQNSPVVHHEKRFAADRSSPQLPRRQEAGPPSAAALCRAERSQCWTPQGVHLADAGIAGRNAGGRWVVLVGWGWGLGHVGSTWIGFRLGLSHVGFMLGSCSCWLGLGLMVNMLGFNDDSWVFGSGWWCGEWWLMAGMGSVYEHSCGSRSLRLGIDYY